jgi:hypothetical protein
MNGEYGQVPWDDAPEEALPPEGEHDLRIMGHEETTTKGNDDPENFKPVRRMIRVSIRVEGPEDYQGVQHYLVFPNKDEWDAEDPDDLRTPKMMLRNVRRFLRIFGIDETTFQPEDLDGSTGRGVVGHRYNEDNGETYPELRLPRAR